MTHKLLEWTNEDAEPFALGYWDHVAKTRITRTMVKNFLRSVDDDDPDRWLPRKHVVEHTYVRVGKDPDDELIEGWAQTYFFCKADHPDAKPITCVRFYD